MKKLPAVITLASLIIIGFVALALSDADKTNAGWFDPAPSGETQREEISATENNQKRLLKAVPIPSLQDSQERRNLVKRLERFNTGDKVSYIYLVNYGKVMAFYTVQGKVSSVNSLLTSPEQIVDDPHGGYDSGGRVVSSPDIDGSYGSNGDAIFFFTTEDVYVEWRGDYMLVDQPLQLSTPPELVRTVK